MAIYEYQCIQCGEKFEVRQSMGKDGSNLNCPECHAQNPRRLISLFFSPNSTTDVLSEISCPTCSSGVCNLPQYDN